VNITANRKLGTAWEDWAYSDLSARFPESQYLILRNNSLKYPGTFADPSLAGKSVRIGGSIQKPDFIVINRASGRLVAYAEAGAGSYNYLTGPKETQLFVRYSAAVEKMELGYQPEVVPYYALRTGGRPILEPTVRWLSRITAVVQLADIAVESFALGREYEQEKWLIDNDLDFFCSAYSGDMRCAHA